MCHGCVATIRGGLGAGLGSVATGCDGLRVMLSGVGDLARESPSAAEVEDIVNSLFIITFVLLWIVVIALAVSVLALSRQIGVLLERVAPAGALMTNKGLAPGELAPELTIGDSTGSPVRIGGKRSDARSMLVFFLSPSCPMCKAVLPAVRSTARRERAWLDVVLASDGDDEDHAGLIRREKITDLPYVVSQELGMGFRVGQIPHAALVGDDGRIIAAGLTNTREHVESLVEAKREGVGSLNEYMVKNAKNSADENVLS